MSEQAVPEYRVVLTTDIEDYSSRTDAEQWVMQAAFRRALDDAAEAAGLKPQEWHSQLSGDGLFAILPSGTDVTQLLDRFLRELDAELGGYNRRRREQAWTRMRLRLAVHAGPVYLNGPTGFPGHHAVEPARLCDSQPVRAVLAALPGADLAVIVSSDIYRDYVTQGPGNPRPTEFRTVLAQVKKESYTAHLLVPGFDVHAVAALAMFDASDMSQLARRSDPREGTSVAPGQDSPSSDRDAPRVLRAGGNMVASNRNRASGGGSVYTAGGDIGSGMPHGRNDQQ
jgi:hypothetical protein